MTSVSTLSIFLRLDIYLWRPLFVVDHLEKLLSWQSCTFDPVASFLLECISDAIYHNCIPVVVKYHMKAYIISQLYAGTSYGGIDTYSYADDLGQGGRRHHCLYLTLSRASLQHIYHHHLLFQFLDGCYYWYSCWNIEIFQKMFHTKCFYGCLQTFKGMMDGWWEDELGIKCWSTLLGSWAGGRTG